MNPAIMAAIAASNAETTCETVVQRLRKAGAIKAERAIAIEVSSAAEKTQLDDALIRGLVIKRADGLYYLDERAIADRNEGLGFAVLLGLLIAGSVAASSIALVMFAAR
ncbi:MAG: hypothetical protein M3Q57_03370 [Pseudomonadota bacterium]|nr:hypothetical protein [Pseudomonadota bacterium]